MTKKELVDSVLSNMNKIEEYRKYIIGLEENIKKTSKEMREIEVLYSIYENSQKSNSKNIDKNRKLIYKQLEEAQIAINKYGKQVPCTIVYDGKLIVITDDNISIEENVIS